MVIRFNVVQWLMLIADAAEAPQRALERLDPLSRAFALLSLVALILFGIVFVLAAVVGGHWARRRAQVRYGPTKLHNKTTVQGSGKEESDDVRLADGESISTAETLMDLSNKETQGKGEGRMSKPE